MSGMENEKQGRWFRICGSIRARVFKNPVKQEIGLYVGAGAHYYFRITEARGRNYIELGTTHHGVRFDCTEVNGEFELIINKLRAEYPEHRTD